MKAVPQTSLFDLFVPNKTQQLFGKRLQTFFLNVLWDVSGQVSGFPVKNCEMRRRQDDVQPAGTSDRMGDGHNTDF